MQNNIFQLDRFYKLLKRKMLFQSKKTIIQTIISFVGIPLLFLTVALISGDDFGLTTRTSFFMAIMIGLFLAAPFHYFSDINEPRKGLMDAMLPASLLEKYIMMQFTCLIVAPLLPFVMFGGTDWIISTLAPSSFDGSVYSNLKSVKEIPWDMLMSGIALQQLVIFFNMHFIRNKKIKTLGTIIVLHIAGMLLFFLAIRLFAWDFVTGSMTGADININLLNGDSLFFSLKDHPIIILIQLTRIFAAIILPTGLLIGSYYKLKSIKF